MFILGALTKKLLTIAPSRERIDRSAPERVASGIATELMYLYMESMVEMYISYVIH